MKINLLNSRRKGGRARERERVCVNIKQMKSKRMAGARPCKEVWLPRR